MFAHLSAGCCCILAVAAAVRLPPLHSSLSARAAGSRAVRSRGARIGTRGTVCVAAARRGWRGSPARRPPLELAVTRRRLISRADEQPRSVAAMGAGCVHRSRSRHVAVRARWSRTCRRSRTTLGRRCSQPAPAAAAAGSTRSPHWPRYPVLACATTCRIRLLRCCTPVAAVAPKLLARVAGLSASSPDRRPLRRCHFGSRHSRGRLR